MSVSWPIGSRDWLFTDVRHLCFGNKWHNGHFRIYECKSNKFTPRDFVVTFHLAPRPTRHLFLCRQEWLLNLHKRPLASVKLRNQMNPNLRPLFCLYIQHAIRCLFERQSLNGSPEVAGCSFCFSIPRHFSLRRNVETIWMCVWALTCGRKGCFDRHLFWLIVCVPRFFF